MWGRGTRILVDYVVNDSEVKRFREDMEDISVPIFKNKFGDLSKREFKIQQKASEIRKKYEARATFADSWWARISDAVFFGYRPTMKIAGVGVLFIIYLFIRLVSINSKMSAKIVEKAQFERKVSDEWRNQFRASWNSSMRHQRFLAGVATMSVLSRISDYYYTLGLFVYEKMIPEYIDTGEIKWRKAPKYVAEYSPGN